jgi:microcystin degradation protein MlrC
MARIAVGGLHHETNSFAPQPADFEQFVQADGWPALQRGAGLFEGVAGVNLAITGFVDEAHARGHELVPTLWANACPSGPVTEDAYERLLAMLLEDVVRAGPFDAVFLDLHGAMVTEHLEDG